jgi:flagellar basal body rod protein FlgC
MATTTTTYRQARMRNRRRANTRRHAATVGVGVALCGILVRAPGDDTPEFDPEHPDACQRCVYAAEQARRP